MGRAREDMGRNASFRDLRFGFFGFWNSKQPTNFQQHTHVVNCLVQPASQSAIEQTCIRKAVYPLILSHATPFHYPPSFKSITLFTHSPSDDLFHQLPIIYQFNQPNHSSSMNTTIPLIHFIRSFQQSVQQVCPHFSPILSIAHPSSSPTPPTKFQQHQSNGERTSV